VTVLAPGASTTCTASYTVTQADVDNGSIANSAVANGVAPCPIQMPVDGGGAGVAAPVMEMCPVVSQSSTAVVTAKQVAGLSLDKVAGTPVDVNADGHVDAGDLIPYTFVVTNTGNVTLTGIAVSDAMVGSVTCPSTALLPGASMTCGPVSYQITAADVAAGQVVNTATVSGSPPTGVTPPVGTDTTTTVTSAVPPLPHTGTEAGRLAESGALLLALGVALTLLGRRRRAEESGLRAK
jgi:uncharacterized repeat protein (TIGR01451 family)